MDRANFETSSLDPAALMILASGVDDEMRRRRE